ncbi:response regulator transcription factor [Thermoleptolyngbya sp. C42_A2020_037]|uniref:response regulator n=1 Tax=Thermoleptolyngbya sp. C42_A2020_037 TaxID=2747799 RepID=UPI001A09071F|nr:response regulator transcription factor [Thermoleptolyngbya sp. C42_A2020_037]MBF2085663.1 response regulator transcription factor [Thermoleptolyngbya sp. C42_A2020_037]
MIQVLIVEDQDIIRRGLKTLIRSKSDLHVVGEASNGQEALEQLTSLHSQDQAPDVILMDIRMPIMDGVMATQKICQQFPSSKILILTTFDDTEYVSEALRFGAKGYLLKDTPSEELAEVIRMIHRGYTQFSPGILEKMMATVSASATKPSAELPPGLAELTARERQVLLLIAKGATNREIAESLFLSPGTVRDHISNILGRLNLHDRTQAAIVAVSCLDWLEDRN